MFGFPTMSSNDVGKRRRVGSPSQTPEDEDEDLRVTPPPSPSPPPSPAPCTLTEEITRLKMELEEKSEEVEFYKSKCKNLEDDLQEVKRQNINYRERCHQEIKKKVGIHTTNALAPRLDDEDYKTICNTYKYKALKKETTSKDLKDQMLTLTREGIIYLKESCGVNVNKNGEKCQDGNPFTPISTSRHKDAQRYDNRLINLLLTYYTEPKMCESRPKRNIENYKVKANVFGYKGDREHFEKLEAELELKPGNLLLEMVYLKVFKSVKSILDSKISVSSELF